jgi:hypothetical protein
MLRAYQQFGDQTPEQLAASIAAETAPDEVLNAMQCAMALLFGDSRRWHLTEMRFGLFSLARGQDCDGIGDEWLGKYGFEGEILDCFDHPYWYRRKGRPAAIVAHLYHGERLRPRCAAIARSLELRFETPDFPSWWAPGRTTLVTFIGPAAE